VREFHRHELRGEQLEQPNKKLKMEKPMDKPKPKPTVDGEAEENDSGSGELSDDQVSTKKPLRACASRQ
jgi:hypothetical protein